MAPRILDEPGSSNEEKLLKDIEKNLPSQVCPAHSLLILYIQDMNKTMKDELSKIEKKVDLLIEYKSEEQGKGKEKDNNEVTTNKRKDVILGAILGFIFTLIIMIITQFTHP